jgi:dienelactone hydrolase
MGRHGLLMDPSRREFLSTLSAAGLGAFAGTVGPGTASEASITHPFLSAIPGSVGSPEQGPNPFGNQSSFLKSLEMDSAFSLSWLRDEFTNHGAWSEKARSILFERLLYHPPPAAPSPEIVERRDMGTYIREKVYFNTTPQIRVPAYLLIPKNVKTPAPAIVALHDHGAMYYWGKEKIVATEADNHPVLKDFKAKYYGGNSFTTDLVNAGFVVIAIDMFYWGERRTDFRQVPAFRDRCVDPPGGEEDVRRHNQLSAEHLETLARAIFLSGHTWAGIMFWDDLRTVDFLATRPEVDPNRIGCVGLSVGAFRSNFLVALDPRIQAAVSVCWMTTFRDLYPDHILNTAGWMKMIPGIHADLDLPDIMALAIPRPLLVIDGKQDGLFPRTGVDNAYDKIARAYSKAGVSGRFRPHTYDTPHLFNRQMQEEVLEWFKKWL